jgi:ion channel-forming bestrophin family protein
MIHYDPKNWVGILLDIPKSRVFRTLFFDVLGAGAWAALVVWVEKDYFKVAVPLGPSFLSILGIILGLLLVFRTNTAYDRWWEGRKLWGQLVNVSRGMAHYLDAALPAGSAARAPYAEALTRYPVALAQHLRTLAHHDGEHVPNAVLRTLSHALHRDVAAGVLPADARLTLMPLVQSFNDVTGACERISRTPIPQSYSSYVKQFVLLYAFVMPFGLVEEFGYGTVIASMFTFFATMGLELLATEIEEPFGTDANDLPLENIAARIGRDMQELLRPPLADATTA